jgi:ribonuclease D
MNMKIHFHEGDLPSGVDFGKSVAIDTETLGLNPLRDALCLAQLSGGDGHCHIVRFDRKTYHAPNMVRLLTDSDVLKIFHYARFDVGVFQKHLNTATTPVWCTKIASKLVRTYTDKHGLKDLVKELLDVDLSKQQQSSDWGAAKLSDAQLSYAASDVLHLHKLKATLDAMLVREGRQELALKCFGFVNTRAQLDLAGWALEDIFAH